MVCIAGWGRAVIRGGPECRGDGGREREGGKEDEATIAKDLIRTVFWDPIAGLSSSNLLLLDAGGSPVTRSGIEIRDRRFLPRHLAATR
eukprot:scaffold251331_cov14-Tisochrysis_lutea.AAC.1